MATEYPWRVGVAATVLVLALFGFLAWHFFPTRRASPFGTTTGEIIVSSPEVYSRERLVNDRFQQATWLNRQLDRTDELEWGPQATIESTTIKTAKAGASIASSASDTPSKEGSSTAGSGTRTPTTGDERDSAPAKSESTDGAARRTDASTRPPPIEVFRDKLAYRDEVRAATMETQLDDRHDIAGNTLYRIKFGIAVIPEHDTSAWAVVYVHLREPSDDRHRPTYEDTYREWLEHYEERLNDDLDRRTEQGIRSWVPEDYRPFLAYLATTLPAKACANDEPGCHDALAAKMTSRLQQAQANLKARAEREAKARQTQCEQYAKENPALGLQCATADTLENLCAPSADVRQCPWNLDDYARVEAALDVYREISSADIPSAAWPTTGQFLRKVVGDYLLYQLEQRTRQFWPTLWNARPTDCDIGLCRISLAPKDGGLATFKAALDADQVFADAATPKESVQRIANLAASQRERQVMLRSTVARQIVPVDLLGLMLSETEKDDLLLNSMLRKPLIVGFADRAYPNAGGTPGGNTAAFGWIIGPKFDINAGEARFRHVAIENDVSAVISVPSWWKWAEIQITTCWIDEREVHARNGAASNLTLYSECKAGLSVTKPESHIIRLPGNVTEIARKLGLDVVRRPATDWVKEIRTVTADAPADFLIRGYHLWRSTVVTLQGQPATKITVLPDMKGILAHFDRISPQWVGQTTGLYVFTSEGAAQAATVVVKTPVPSETSSPKDSKVSG